MNFQVKIDKIPEKKILLAVCFIFSLHLLHGSAPGKHLVKEKWTHTGFPEEIISLSTRWESFHLAATSNGQIYVFNQHVTRQISYPGKPLIRKGLNNTRLWIGGQNAIGYLTRDGFLKFMIRDVFTKVDNPQTGQIRDIIETGQSLYFISDSGFFELHGKQGHAQKLADTHHFASLHFCQDDLLIFSDKEKALYYWNGKNLEVIAGTGSVFKCFTWNDTLCILDEHNRIFQLKEKKITATKLSLPPGETLISDNYDYFGDIAVFYNKNSGWFQLNRHGEITFFKNTMNTALAVPDIFIQDDNEVIHVENKLAGRFFLPENIWYVQHGDENIGSFIQQNMTTGRYKSPHDKNYWNSIGKQLALKEDQSKIPDTIPLPEGIKMNQVRSFFTIGDKIFIIGTNKIYRWNQYLHNHETLKLPFLLKKNLSHSVFNGYTAEHVYLSWKNENREIIISEFDPVSLNASYFILPGTDNIPDMIVRSSDSSIIIASAGNLLHVHHEFLERYLKSPPLIYIKSLLLQDTIITAMPDKILRFPSSRNSLTFFIGFLSQGSPVKEVKYWLEGYDTEEKTLNSENIIQYHDLDAGEYVLHAKAINTNGICSETLDFPFQVDKPFYTTIYAFIGYFIIVIAGSLIYLRWRSYRFMQNKVRLESIVNERVEYFKTEKDRTDSLIANLLPKTTAEELRKKGKASSKKFELVTVLFSDIEGFTRIAEQMNPEALIDQLDSFFFHFDSVVEKYNIEKIKTIGDAYMCAGGIPYKNRTNPIEVVLAALEMQFYMLDLKKNNAEIWDLRIGIHTGPVIAGVIGSKKLSYDIWGDTVNVASRMESSGEAGKINISGQTYNLIKDYFICEYRGKMPVKYKGEIDMYFVKTLKPELSIDLKFRPNRRFILQLKQLRIEDISEHVFNLMQLGFPDNLYFHSMNHVQDVYRQAELIGRAEGIDEEDLICLKLAAMFMYTGYIKDYENYIDRSIEFARELLPLYNFSHDEIEKACNLILVTKMPYDPVSKTEKVLIDAKLSYLGRKGIDILINKLFEEYREYQKISSRDELIKQQVNFLKSFHFYTETARKLSEVTSEEQIKILKKMI